MWHNLGTMSQCRICKNESPEGARVCSPKCEDAFEDLKIQRNWAAIQYGDALVELQGCEQRYDEPYGEWEETSARIRLLEAGIRTLSRPLSTSQPTLAASEAHGELTRSSAKLLEAKLREHNEWKEAQQKSNLHDAAFGEKWLESYKERLEELDCELNKLDQQHDVLQKTRRVFERRVRKLNKRLGD